MTPNKTKKGLQTRTDDCAIETRGSSEAGDAAGRVREKVATQQWQAVRCLSVLNSKAFGIPEPETPNLRRHRDILRSRLLG